MSLPNRSYNADNTNNKQHTSNGNGNINRNYNNIPNPRQQPLARKFSSRVLSKSVSRKFKYHKKGGKHSYGRSAPVLHTIPEVSFLEGSSVPKEETFVVANWKDILGDDVTSAHLRHRKAVALAKVNARHVINSWNDHQQHQHPQHPHIHYKTSSTFFSPSPHSSSSFSVPSSPSSSMSSLSSSSLSSSYKQRRKTNPKPATTSKTTTTTTTTTTPTTMHHSKPSHQHFIQSKERGMRTDHGERIHFAWDSSTNIDYITTKPTITSTRASNVPSAVSKLYQAKERKRLQSKKKTVDGMGSKSAPTLDKARRSSSSSGKRRRKLIASSKEKSQKGATQEGKTSPLPKRKTPREAFVSAEQDSPRSSSKHLLDLNVSSDGLSFQQASTNPHSDSDKENKLSTYRTFSKDTPKDGERHEDGHSVPKIDAGILPIQSTTSHSAIKSTKSVSFSDTSTTSIRTQTSFSQSMENTYLDIHKHNIKYNSNINQNNCSNNNNSNNNHQSVNATFTLHSSNASRSALPEPDFYKNHDGIHDDPSIKTSQSSSNPIETKVDNTTKVTLNSEGINTELSDQSMRLTDRFANDCDDNITTTAFDDDDDDDNNDGNDDRKGFYKKTNNHGNVSTRDGARFVCSRDDDITRSNGSLPVTKASSSSHMAANVPRQTQEALKGRVAPASGGGSSANGWQCDDDDVNENPALLVSSSSYLLSSAPLAADPITVSSKESLVGKNLKHQRQQQQQQQQQHCISYSTSSDPNGDVIRQHPLPLPIQPPNTTTIIPKSSSSSQLSSSTLHQSSLSSSLSSSPPQLPQPQSPQRQHNTAKGGGEGGGGGGVKAGGKAADSAINGKADNSSGLSILNPSNRRHSQDRTDVPDNAGHGVSSLSHASMTSSSTKTTRMERAKAIESELKNQILNSKQQIYGQQTSKTSKREGGMNKDRNNNTKNGNSLDKIVSTSVQSSQPNKTKKSPEKTSILAGVGATAEGSDNKTNDEERKGDNLANKIGRKKGFTHSIHISNSDNLNSNTTTTAGITTNPKMAATATTSINATTTTTTPTTTTTTATTSTNIPNTNTSSTIRRGRQQNQAMVTGVANLTTNYNSKSVIKSMHGLGNIDDKKNDDDSDNVDDDKDKTKPGINADTTPATTETKASRMRHHKRQGNKDIQSLSSLSSSQASGGGKGKNTIANGVKSKSSNNDHHTIKNSVSDSTGTNLSLSVVSESNVSDTHETRTTQFTPVAAENGGKGQVGGSGAGGGGGGGSGGGGGGGDSRGNGAVSSKTITSNIKAGCVANGKLLNDKGNKTNRSNLLPFVVDYKHNTNDDDDDDNDDDDDDDDDDNVKASLDTDERSGVRRDMNVSTSVSVSRGDEEEGEEEEDSEIALFGYDGNGQNKKERKIHGVVTRKGGELSFTQQKQRQRQTQKQEHQLETNHGSDTLSIKNQNKVDVKSRGAEIVGINSSDNDEGGNNHKDDDNGENYKQHHSDSERDKIEAGDSLSKIFDENSWRYKNAYYSYGNHSVSLIDRCDNSIGYDNIDSASNSTANELAVSQRSDVDKNVESPHKKPSKTDEGVKDVGVGDTKSGILKKPTKVGKRDPLFSKNRESSGSIAMLGDSLGRNGGNISSTRVGQNDEAGEKERTGKNKNVLMSNDNYDNKTVNDNKNVDERDEPGRGMNQRNTSKYLKDVKDDKTIAIHKIKETTNFNDTTNNMVGREAIDNLFFQSNFDVRDGEKNNLDLSGSKVNNKSLEANDVIYTKPVMVRPKTAGMSNYANDRLFDNDNGNVIADEFVDGELFMASYLKGVSAGTSGDALNDPEWNNDIYLDDDIKFINTDDDYYEIFGYNDETTKILEATRVYPLESFSERRQNRKTRFESKGENASRSNRLNSSPDYKNSIRDIKKSDVGSSSSSSKTKAILPASQKKIVPKLTLNISPERNQETGHARDFHDKNKNKSKNKKNRDGHVNLSNEEKETKSKLEVKEMVARCESDDSIYRSSQYSGFFQGKTVSKGGGGGGGGGAARQNITNKSLPRKDTLANNNISHLSTSFINTNTATLVQNDSYNTSKNVPSLPSSLPSKVKSEAKYSTESNNFVVFDNNYNNKKPLRSRKLSYEPVQEEPFVDSKLKERIIGDVEKERNRMKDLDLNPSSLNPYASHKSLTQIRRRFRSEADIDTNSLNDNSTTHVKNNQNKSRFIGHGTHISPKKHNIIIGNTAGIGNIDNTAGGTVSHPPQPPLPLSSSTFKDTIPNASQLSNQEDHYNSSINLDKGAKQRIDVVKRGKFKDEKHNASTKNEIYSETSGTAYRHVNVNNIGNNSHLFSSSTDDVKKRYGRFKNTSSQPESYEEKMERVKHKFGLNEDSDEEDDAHVNNLRLSQSFNGRGSKSDNNIPLSLSLPKQNKLFKEEDIASKPSAARPAHKTILTPLIREREKETNRIAHAQVNGPLPPPAAVKPRKLKPIIHHGSTQKQRHGLTSGL